MAFSVLLVEKMAGILEDMASMWEETATAAMADPSCGELSPVTQVTDAADRQQHAACAGGGAGGWAQVYLGQYQIDSAQEWHEIFGFLVLLQVRRLGMYLDSLRSNAGRDGLESHRSALGCVALRVQELQEALAGMTTGLGYLHT
jgi:hypothetical protein